MVVMGMMGNMVEVLDLVLVVVILYTVRHVRAEFEYVMQEGENE